PDQLDPGDRGEERSRLRADALRVREVAGIVDRDPASQCALRLGKPELREQRERVANDGGGTASERIVRQEALDLAQERAAARGARDGPVDVREPQRAEEVAREARGAGLVSEVEREGSAAALRARHED